MFKKVLSGTVAAMTISGALMATATPAAAQWRGQTTYANAQYQSRGYDRGDYGRNDYGRGGYDRHRNNSGAVLGAGLLGLVIGAALTSDHNRSYAPQPTYYGPSYNGDCTTYTRWDPRFGRYVEESRCY